MGLVSTPLLSAAIGTTTQNTISLFLRHHRRRLGFLSTAAPLFSSRRCNTNYWRSLAKKTTRRVSSGLVEVEKNGIDDEACELVSGVELTIGEDHDSIQAYLCKAVKNNNRTGVVLLSDIFGFEDSSTRDFAYRVACNGYNVIVPDLFRGDPWGKDRPKTLFEEWLVKQDLNRVVKDINSATKWMVDEFMAAGISNKLAVIGFCYGGGRVIDILAQDQGNCFGIGVSFYGTRINQPVVPNVKVPILFISGDNDPLCPVNVLRDIEKTICKGSQVVVFKGRGHGFVHRPGSLEEDEDAEEVFALMRNWLHDALIVKN